jgi:hypothetical protein
MTPSYVIKKWEPGTHFHEQKQEMSKSTLYGGGLLGQSEPCDTITAVWLVHSVHLSLVEVIWIFCLTKVPAQKK